MGSQKGKIPQSLQTRILSRFMNEKELENLYENYRGACLKVRRERQVTPLDRKILKDYRAGAIFSELCEKYGKSRNWIIMAIAVASKE